MAIAVPTAQEAADKWAAVTPTRQPDYVRGVSGAGSRWQSGVDQAAPLWAQATAQAAANGEWGRGVAGKSAKYTTNASTIGAQRFGQGVTAAKPAYAAAIGPVLQVIAGVTLPARGVAGTNLGRVQAVNDALHNWKITS
jgi:hypothetical protein